MRRATAKLEQIALLLRISIHALHEESDMDSRQRHLVLLISIHALHEESDPVRHL